MIVSVFNYNALKAHIHQLMLTQLDARLVYHSLAHTFEDVLPAAERIAQLEGVDAEATLLVQTAAILHDVGFIKIRDGHEAASAAIARDFLPDYGYRPAQIDAIAGMIMATRLPQSPQNLLEQILADADLDVLGRDDFAIRNQALRDELAAYGTTFSDEDWYRNQRGFLQSHSYFTSVSGLHDSQKQHNIDWLSRCLEDASNP